MTISLLVAASENNVIGKDGKLPWHLPNDLKFFKNTTWGMPVIMGRKTFQSEAASLPGRTNIVISRKENWDHPKNVKVAKSIQDGLKLAEETDAREVFIIGGGEIFKQSIQLADKIYMTRVHTTLDGDTFFPEIRKSQWKLIKNQDFSADKKHAYPYSFEVWVK